ncbi:hypothetical protein [uncultured Draconibacterium sp.]|uniref:hypothetical protein n=1 Tax=uncultured Draconibacterium sp. TaxID=1573823 RepID=UPI0029C9132F|nr:hypothetical protein [uncultured Draconibacterium sp.]
MTFITPDVFLANVQPGNIYYFQSDQLNGTNQPHYFIALKNTENELVFFSCCTTQMERRLRFIERTGSPHSTLVGITPSAENGLQRESFVDCNSIIQHTHDEIAFLVTDGGIDYRGELEEEYLELIYQGIRDSILLEEEVQDLLIPE